MIKGIIIAVLGATAMYFFQNSGDLSEIKAQAQKGVHTLASEVADATAPTMSERADQAWQTAKDSVVNVFQ